MVVGEKESFISEYHFEGDEEKSRPCVHSSFQWIKENDTGCF